jgi:hypothetical protein
MKPMPPGVVHGPSVSCSSPIFSSFPTALIIVL